MATLSQLFAILAPVLTCVVVGIAWGRRGDRFDADFITRLITAIGAPALVFHTLANLAIDPAALGPVIIATLAGMAVCAATAVAGLRIAGLSVRAFLPVLLFPNTGNMGLPLSLLAFGSDGLAIAVVIFALYLVAQFTVGIVIASGSLAVGPLLRSPLLWAAPIAVVFPLAGATPPAWLNATTQLLGGMTIPLMLITLGVSLTGLRATSVRLSAGLAVARIALGLGSGIAAASIVGLDAPAWGVLVLQSAMPTAVFNYLFAQRYGQAADAVAGAVMASTLLSFAALPLILMALL